MNKQLICFSILGILLSGSAIDAFEPDNGDLNNKSSIAIDKDIVDI